MAQARQVFGLGETALRRRLAQVAVEVAGRTPTGQGHYPEQQRIQRLEMEKATKKAATLLAEEGLPTIR